MFHTRRFISSFFLAAVLAAPLAVMAAPAPQDAGVQVRVYDRDHKDYHNWDDHEDHAYRAYLTERHEQYRAALKEKKASAFLGRLSSCSRLWESPIHCDETVNYGLAVLVGGFS